MLLKPAFTAAPFPPLISQNKWKTVHFAKIAQALLYVHHLSHHQRSIQVFPIDSAVQRRYLPLQNGYMGNDRNGIKRCHANTSYSSVVQIFSKSKRLIFDWLLRGNLSR